MASKTRLYRVKDKSGAQRLIEASTPRGAIAYVARNEFTADIPAQHEVFAMAKSGVEFASTQTGTKITMAPEILWMSDENCQYNYKADIWSIGVVFYQMLFEDVPFFGLSNAELMSSITRNSAGKYTIVLNSTFNRLLMLDCIVLLASGLPAAPVVNVVEDNSAEAAKSIVIQFSGPTAADDTALVATDPGNGETLLISMKLKNAST
jgi:serine/threonine protein kinase